MEGNWHKEREGKCCKLYIYIVLCLYRASKKTTYADLQPGDLVFYKEDGEISHVAFYIGKITYRGEQHHTAIVHAATRKDGICVSPLYAGERKYGTYWR